jgi:hypothetical protein
VWVCVSEVRRSSRDKAGHSHIAESIAVRQCHAVRVDDEKLARRCGTKCPGSGVRRNRSTTEQRRRAFQAKKSSVHVEAHTHTPSQMHAHPHRCTHRHTDTHTHKHRCIHTPRNGSAAEKADVADATRVSALIFFDKNQTEKPVEGEDLRSDTGTHRPVNCVPAVATGQEWMRSVGE